MLYPSPTPQKENWTAQPTPKEAGFLIVQPTPQKENWTPLAAPNQGKVQNPAAPVSQVQWAPAAVAPNPTAYKSAVTTQIEIDTFFAITDRRLLPASSTSDINGNTIVLAPPQ